MMTWTMEIADLRTDSRVGIWPHELHPQPLRVSMTLRVVATAFPQTIDECLDYEPLCKWICGAWSGNAHTPLLETRVRELTDFIFAYDGRIEWAAVKIVKSNAVRQAGGVGISIAMSRSEYEASFGMRSAPKTTMDTAVRAAIGIDHAQSENDKTCCSSAANWPASEPRW